MLQDRSLGTGATAGRAISEDADCAIKTIVMLMRGQISTPLLLLNVDNVQSHNSIHDGQL